MAHRVLVLDRGPCLEVDRRGLDHSTYEVFTSIIKVNSAHNYQVRIERSASVNCNADHATFNLSEATILVPDAQCGVTTKCSTEKELWSFTEGFSEERLIEVAGETLVKLRTYYAKCHNKTSLEIVPKQFYSQSSKIASTTLNKNERIGFGIFRVFPRQEFAFQYFDDLFAEQCNLNKQFNLKIFCFEAPRTGQRKFLVADYDTFFRSYLESGINNKTEQENGGDSSNHRGYPIECNGNKYAKNFNNYSTDKNYGNNSFDKNKTANVERNNSDKSARLKPQKHVYEIIRENTPCRAYFDLEFQKEYNTEINGNTLTAIWINLVVWKLSELYGINLNNDNIVVLDSSTEKKYSKHVIIIISNYSYPSFTSLSSSLFTTTSQRNYINESENFLETPEKSQGKEILFRNNIAVGALVNLIMRDITEITSKSEINEIDESSKMSNDISIPVQNISTCSNQSKDSQNSDNSGPKNELIKMKADSKPDSYCQTSVNQRIPKSAFDQLWVNKENGKKQCFVDLGVYTKNRAFRLWDSSKFGKNVPFLILAEDRKKYRGLKFTENHKKEDQYDTYGHSIDKNNNTGIQQLQDFTLKRSLIVPFDLFSDINFSSKDNKENISSCVKSKVINNNVISNLNSNINDNVNNDINQNMNNNVKNGKLEGEFIDVSREHNIKNIENVSVAIDDNSIPTLSDTQKRHRDEYTTVDRHSNLVQNVAVSSNNTVNRNNYDFENKSDIFDESIVDHVNNGSGFDGCNTMKKKKVESDVGSDDHTLSLFSSSVLPVIQNLVDPRSVIEESEKKKFHSIGDILDSQCRASSKYLPFLELSCPPYEKHINNFNGSYDGKYHQNNNYQKSWKNNEILSSTTYRNSSPFPNVDNFVYNFVIKGGVQGFLGKDKIDFLFLIFF